MTDEEHMSAIRAATDVLNRALMDASRIGLKVRVERETCIPPLCSGGAPYHPMKVVEAMRTISYVEDVAS